MQDFELRRVPDFLRQHKLILERGEENVARHGALDQREVKVGTQRQRLRIDLRAATDEDFTAIIQRGQRFQRMDRLHAGMQPAVLLLPQPGAYRRGQLHVWDDTEGGHRMA